MTQRDKHKYTYKAIVSEITRLEKHFAELIVKNDRQETLKLNTLDMQQDIGRLKALREVLFN